MVRTHEEWLDHPQGNATGKRAMIDSEQKGSDRSIIPFRGESFSIKPERRSLIRNLIYPVPDSRRRRGSRLSREHPRSRRRVALGLVCMLCWSCSRSETSSPVDVTPPVIAMTAPANGASVNGIVMLAATASDNGGIAGVQFFVDGTPLGGEVTSGPYSTSWNTSLGSTGNHTIDAVARDFSSNTTRSAAVSVTVTVASGGTLGQWSAPFDWPLIPLHAALLRTGEVI